MIKLRLKRKMSGKKIREDKRKSEFDPYKKYDNKYVYTKNKLEGQKKRDNPNLLTDDKPIGARFTSIRVPSKKRKSAWKRFKKNFPMIEVTETGKKIFVRLRNVEEYPLNPQKKKIIN